MYQAHFGLARDPFSLDPDLAFLYLSKAHEEAIAHLAFGLEQDEDIILITGDIGTGKTMALHRLLGNLSGSFESVVINVTSLDFDQVLRFVLRKVAPQADPPQGTADLLLALESVLVEMRQRGRKILLVVDEAQNFPVGVLEGVRMLLNLARPGEQALQLVLVGQLGLEDKLNRADLRQLRQRIRVAYRFEYLTREETGAYVRHRIDVAGGDGRIVKDEALDRIHELSGGVPRLVNYHADRALLAAYVADAKRVGAGHVVPGTDTPDAPEAASAAPLPADAPAGAAADAGASAPVQPRRPADAPPVYGRRRDRGGSRRAVVSVAVLMVFAALVVLFWQPLLGFLTAPAAEQTPPAPLTGAAGDAASVAGDELAAVPAVAGADTGVSTVQAVAPDTVRNAALSLEPSAAGVTEPTGVTGVPADGGAISTPVPAPIDSFSVHVSSFATPDRAATMRSRLQARGVPIFIRQATLEGKRMWYRVYLGPFATESAARRWVAELQADGTIRYYSLGHVRPGGE